MEYSTIVRAAAKEVGVDAPVEICINATEKGSLNVIVSAVMDNAPGLLSFLNDNSGAIEVLLTTITTVTGLFKFKKWLSGKSRIESAEKTGDGSGDVVIVAGGETTVIDGDVYNVYVNQPAATDAVDHTFRILEDNPAIEGFELIKDDDRVFRAERGEFSGIASSPNYENENTQHVRRRTVISIVKMWFYPTRSRSWTVIYDNTEVSAFLGDEDFIERMGNYNFTQGTKMDVTMDILQEYDAAANAYLNKKYTIAEVHDVVNVASTEEMALD